MVWLEGTVLLILAAGLYYLSMVNAAFAEWYRENIYRMISEQVSRISGTVPFSVTELAAGLMILILAGSFLGIFRRGPKAGRFFRWLGGTYLTAALLALLYVTNCGINYRSVPFSEKSGLAAEVRKNAESDGYDRRALAELCAYIAERLNEAEGKRMEHAEDNGMERSAENVGETRTAVSYGAETEIGEEARKAMEGLSDEYPDLSGYYPIPKPLVTSRFFSEQQVTGIYLPFFVEAAWNRDIPGYNRPFTACHELSHLRGFMREDEANFIAFLACIRSENAAFARSGWLEGWVYAGNALAAEDPEAFSALYGEIPESMKKELAENNAYWDRFRGKAAEVHEKVNDAYLRAGGQEEGVKSYGRIVDLMLAHARRQGWKPVSYEIM
ncbi:DUF3810 domain-containing protein [[Clostridium] aminophilum]|uniref:DUF3810 domain-containing protein n=1 Tax=[Clostridium] aminophilum TaxID=1526 RepID=UPI003F9CBE51